MSLAEPLTARRATAPAAPGAPPRLRLTADDLLALEAAGLVDPEESIEVVDGEMYVMQAKHVPHERWRAFLIGWFARRVPKGWVVLSEPSLRFGPDLVEPDIVIARRALLDRQTSGVLAPEPSDIALVIEIASSTARFDLGAKAVAYARHGIADYWVLETESDMVTLHRDPAESGYGAIDTAPTSATLTPLALPELALRPLDALV
jgi:Uma2 family endonuclease